ncbi:MAG: ribonuclease Z [Gemmatimonadetes bacterium]|nr:ribonuclease Z [Gemmatimonadota bacterium]
MLRLTFLGTASSRPTVSRNVSSLALQREGRLVLLDCGEGTQRQMMRYGVGFAVTDIFISHLHGDHYLGLTGLLRTMSLQGRPEPLRVWGPPGSARTLRTARDLGGDRLTFDAPIGELSPGEAVEGDGYRIAAFDTDHTRASIGFALIEDPRPGRFDVGRARELGVPEGPAFGRLHRGEPIELADGTVVTADDVVGPPRPGRTLVYTADTRPTERTVEVAEGADLLVHEATFEDAAAGRAMETGHSTSVQAARIAARAGVRRLVLTHISARYAEQPGRLLEEARAVFAASMLAKDGWTVEIPFPDEAEGPE